MKIAVIQNACLGLQAKTLFRDRGELVLPKSPT